MVSTAIIENTTSASCQQVFSEQADIFTTIYQPTVNMAVWQRQLSESVNRAVKVGLAQNLQLNVTQEVPVDGVLDNLNNNYALSLWPTALREDIAQIVEMFGCLFDIDMVGLRLRTLNAAMCPKFHYDRVPCRLVTTYSGTGTQWLPNDAIELNESGRLQVIDDNDTHTLRAGDVALLKGSAWPGNESTPLVHRSPCLTELQPRILLTLDAM
ncbi:DUF1826 domain-containing protein [Marisediminitalea sp.]|uniref:DUF1826 domain-containing protein n=1 Tax=Marisediminitalea sp. TaxID=2662268 RepID=UPI003519226E